MVGERPIQAINCLLAGVRGEVSIAQGHRKGAVPEDVADGVQGNTCLHQERSVRVPEVVQAETLEARLLDCPGEFPPQRRERLATIGTAKTAKAVKGKE